MCLLQVPGGLCLPNFASHFLLKPLSLWGPTHYPLDNGGLILLGQVEVVDLADTQYVFRCFLPSITHFSHSRSQGHFLLFPGTKLSKRPVLKDFTGML